MPGIVEKEKDPEIVKLEESGALALLPNTNQILELQTILKDKNTEHSDFVFYADRLMRLVIEEALNKLPYTEITITTPTHCQYKGIQFMRGNCGVSLCRSGEAMEFALRQCCRSIRICKMLIGELSHRIVFSDEQRVLYARLIPDMSHRRVLLLYPVVSTGTTVLKAISALMDSKVQEQNIYLTTLFITPHSIKTICSKFPRVTVITSDVTTGVPYSFAMKYFGTD
ncbi:hypothetical protein Q1695_010191 [Nippostrongylus brasiliensis]|nr:hypothetical protein Q1695_010191 [Nippostrongylus brasiliensis]